MEGSDEFDPSDVGYRDEVDWGEVERSGEVDSGDVDSCAELDRAAGGEAEGVVARAGEKVSSGATSSSVLMPLTRAGLCRRRLMDSSLFLPRPGGGRRRRLISTLPAVGRGGGGGTVAVSRRGGGARTGVGAVSAACSSAGGCGGKRRSHRTRVAFPSSGGSWPENWEISRRWRVPAGPGPGWRVTSGTVRSERWPSPRPRPSSSGGLLSGTERERYAYQTRSYTE